MGHQKSTARLLKISALVSIVMAFTTLLSGQEYTPGQPVIANSTKGTVTDGVSWDAKAFPGSDICAQLREPRAVRRIPFPERLQENCGWATP